MKKVINKKMYNTETAKKVAGWSNGLSNSDFNAIDEDLYLTKKGNFFIYYFGGANTQYAEANGNMMSGSEGIMPVEKEKALRWLEDKGKTEEIEEYFNNDIEEA